MISDNIQVKSAIYQDTAIGTTYPCYQKFKKHKLMSLINDNSYI